MNVTTRSVDMPNYTNHVRNAYLYKRLLTYRWPFRPFVSVRVHQNDSYLSNMERRTFGLWRRPMPRIYYPDYRQMPLPRHVYEEPLMARGYPDMSRHRHRYRDSNTSMHATVTGEMLQLHNRHRARHCARPLTISPQLNQIAQSYAEHLAATSTFEHSGNRLGKEALGENLYMQWISRGRVNVSAKAAVKSWYDEIALHDFKRPVFSAETGHFTQLVWKDTRKMGVGVALSPDQREVYIVTNYYPAGNVVNPGMFERNVLPARC